MKKTIDFATLWSELRRCGKLQLQCLADDAMICLAELQIRIQICTNTGRTMSCLAGSTDECLSLSPLEDLLRPVFHYHLLPNLAFLPFLPRFLITDAQFKHRPAIFASTARHTSSLDRLLTAFQKLFITTQWGSILQLVQWNPLCFQTITFWCGVPAWFININTMCKCRWKSLTNL